MSWKQIVGKAFKTTAEFSAYLDTVQFGAWRPRFIVVHNSSVPDLATYEGHWNRRVPVTDEQWMQNLVGEYRDKNHWFAGPHLFVTPRSICAFTPLNTSGTHSPSWNAISWGVEIVGEFERDSFDGVIKDNAVATLGILHAKVGLQLLPYERGVRGLHLHKEDPATTHTSCPGKNIDKAKLIQAVQAHISQMDKGEHLAGTGR